MSDWKNNRPPKWKNPYHGRGMWTPELKAYEAGADAILEAIKARGYILGESLRNVKGAIGWAGINPDSKWYPIPDEESK